MSHGADAIAQSISSQVRNSFYRDEAASGNQAFRCQHTAYETNLPVADRRTARLRVHRRAVIPWVLVDLITRFVATMLTALQPGGELAQPPPCWLRGPEMRALALSTQRTIKARAMVFVCVPFVTADAYSVGHGITVHGCNVCAASTCKPRK